MPMASTATRLINALLYQAGWFCCLLGAAWDYPVVGALSALALAGVHLLLACSRKADAILMLSACLAGVVVDSVQQSFGVFTFKAHPGWPLWLPLWVFVIWTQFATLFRYALFWLSGRYWLASLLGMVGGPLAYWGGVRLGAAVFGPEPLLSFLSLGVVWALVTPALLWLSAKLSREEGRYRRWRKS
jgi:hypothetical protein